MRNRGETTRLTGDRGAPPIFLGVPEFLSTTPDINKDEYLLPNIADAMLKEGARFTVLPTDDQWFGVTYKEDREAVIESIKKLIDTGAYKPDLFSDL